MPNIMLVHPVHGSKIALSEGEVEHDAKFGWTRYHAPTPVVKPTEAAPVEEAPVKRKYTRKVTEQPIEQPNSNALASDESEGQ